MKSGEETAGGPEIWIPGHGQMNRLPGPQSAHLSTGTNPLRIVPGKVKAMQPSVHTKCQSREPLPLRVWSQGPSRAPLPFHLQHKDNKLEIIECQLTETHGSPSSYRGTPRGSVTCPRSQNQLMAESGCEPSDRKTNHVLMPPEASSPTHFQTSLEISSGVKDH